MVATLLNEEKEKEKRRLNIIVHNVPESSSEESLTKKNEDTEFVSKLCESQFNAKVSIVKAYRLGKRELNLDYLRFHYHQFLRKSQFSRTAPNLEIGAYHLRIRTSLFPQI